MSSGWSRLTPRAGSATISRQSNFSLIDKETVMRAGVKRWFTTWSASAVTAWILISGCGKNADKQADPADAAANAKPAIPAQANAAKPGDLPGSGLVPFKDAALFEPPEGEQRPPDRTMAGKNVGALFEEIAGEEGSPGLWDRIAFTTADGKRVRYAAHLKTDLGTIEIELCPEAPNHVRNFIALSQAGYYNGLVFHRSLNKQMDGQTLAYLEGGCPLGTGEFGLGSIGYWLKPEIAPNLTHEEGTIGAVRGESIESGACKFYICLTKAPGMDGNYTIFGKITKGLDVAHTINKRPVVDDGDASDRPREPVVIREVTIHAGVDDAAVIARQP
jgi:cyclophilin family peptidyl-prolyl cis-trans isomerase